MKPTFVKTFLASTLSTLIIFSNQSIGSESKTELRAIEDVPTEAMLDDAKGELISTIALGSGKNATQLKFVMLPDGYNGHSIGVLEINRGGPGLSDISSLAHETNPRELFHAFASEDQFEPSELSNSYAAPKKGRAGWGLTVLAALPKIDSKAVASAGCNWANFAASFDNLRPDINSTKYWYSAVDGDHDTAGGDYFIQPFPSTWWKIYASNARSTIWNNQYHNYTFYNIDKFKSRVRVCQFETGNEFQDRFVEFRYRSENNVIRAAAYTHQLDASDLGVQYTWIWAPTNGQKDYDWVTLVGGATVWPYAHPDDRYFVAAQKK
jgi:hypothetical protein